MIAKNRRLNASDVRAVLKNGKSLRSNAVLAKYIPAQSGKAAMVVSIKVAKKATERNRLRRAAYAALPTTLPHAHVVFFIQRADFDPADISSLCSKLS